jgi:hypothetical protein
MLGRGSMHHAGSVDLSSESPQSSNFKCRFAEGDFEVLVHPAPIKNFSRMVEKVRAFSDQIVSRPSSFKFSALLGSGGRIRHGGRCVAFVSQHTGPGARFL